MLNVIVAVIELTTAIALFCRLVCLVLPFNAYHEYFKMFDFLFISVIFNVLFYFANDSI